jgi:hypothetical protein
VGVELDPKEVTLEMKTFAQSLLEGLKTIAAYIIAIPCALLVLGLVLGYASLMVALMFVFFGIVLIPLWGGLILFAGIICDSFRIDVGGMTILFGIPIIGTSLATIIFFATVGRDRLSLGSS